MRKKHPKGKEYDTFTNLELRLMETILNPNYSFKEFDFFKVKITSNYIDHSNLYRLSVKYGQDELTGIILNSGRFNINDGELYMEIVGSIIFGGDDRILVHIKNGYLPTKKDIEGIIDTYEEVKNKKYNRDIYQYFLELLHKIKSLD